MGDIIDRRSRAGSDVRRGKGREEVARRWAVDTYLRDSDNPDERAMHWLSVYVVELLDEEPAP